jgi:transposase-like protein
MPRRRYTRTEKAQAVAEAERTSLTAASESTGVPITTLKYWFDSPAFADIRTKTREELAEGSIAMALIAQAELVRRIRSGDISDQALVAAYGVGIDKAQLLSGAATARTETRDISDTLDDHESDILGEAIRAELARRSDAATPEPAVAHPSEAGAEAP